MGVYVTPYHFPTNTNHIPLGVLLYTIIIETDFKKIIKGTNISKLNIEKLVTGSTTMTADGASCRSLMVSCISSSINVRLGYNVVNRKAPILSPTS